MMTSKENYETLSRNSMYEEKLEEVKPNNLSIIRRININSKKNTIFDSNGVLLIGSHKIVKKKITENSNNSNKTIVLSNNYNGNEKEVHITKRIHK